MEEAVLLSLKDYVSGVCVCCKRNALNVTESEKCGDIRLVGLCCKRIAEEKHKVDFIIGNMCTNLLVSALRT